MSLVRHDLGFEGAHSRMMRPGTTLLERPGVREFRAKTNGCEMPPQEMLLPVAQELERKHVDQCVRGREYRAEYARRQREEAQEEAERRARLLARRDPGR